MFSGEKLYLFERGGRQMVLCALGTNKISKKRSHSTSYLINENLSKCSKQLVRNYMTIVFLYQVASNK